jgi:spoIIIJ-associated protein
MVKEFEGRTEKEAIDKAATELGLERDCFDVEIVEIQRGGLFKKGYVKIRVHTSDSISNRPEVQQEDPNDWQRDYVTREARETRKPREKHEARETPEMREIREKYESDETYDKALVPEGEFETKILEYSDKLISLMGIDGRTKIIFREDHKLGLNINSLDSSLIIGRKGKTLDSLQLILTIYAIQLGQDDIRILLDCENYRVRHEESLVRMAYSVAAKVRGNHISILLEPMNPFDRRLIHTTLSDVPDVETKSEGQGQYKQVRVFYKKIPK